MKKILFFPAHSRDTHRTALTLEALKRDLDSGNDVRILDCGAILGGYCALNRGRGKIYCNKCMRSLDKVAGLLDVPRSKFILMRMCKIPDFPEIDSVEKLKNFEIGGINVGVGAASVIMTLNRDYMPDILREQGTVRGFLRTAAIMIGNLERIYREWKFDEFHSFNGRLPSVYPAVMFCAKNGIDYTLFECGANRSKIRVAKNILIHDIQLIKDEISRYWNSANPEEREKLAIKWFADRRGGKYQAMESFTARQKNGLVPSNWDKSKQNIAIFNSSIDEFYAFNCWKNPLSDNENLILKQLLEHYKNDSTKHFYLRVHPNLTKSKRKGSRQIAEIREFSRIYPNLTVIEPESKIDTYALIDLADKVLTFTSTAGFEATYYGKVSILAGKAPYDELDCVYLAKSMEELYKLIDAEGLKPKPRESTYPYAYRTQVYGEYFKYAKATNETDASYKGVPLDLSGNNTWSYVKRLILGRDKSW